MPITAPPATTPFPATPVPGSATFDTDAYDWMEHQDTARTEQVALADNVYDNALEAAAQATAAAASAGTAGSAATAAGLFADAASATVAATLWVADTPYALYEAVISPTDAQTYRRIVAGAGSVDPFLDTTNWRLVSASVQKVMQLKVMDDTTALTTGDGKLMICIPAELDGMDLVEAQGYITTTSSSGVPTVNVRNVTGAVDMLTTRITVDVGELTSYTAATPPVIDAANDAVATGDLIAIDIDIAGTGAKGLGINLTFRRPV